MEKEKRIPLILLPNYLIPETGYSYLNELRPFMKILLLEKSKHGGHAWFRGLTNKKEEQ